MDPLESDISGKSQCDICKKWFKKRGLGSHKAKCLRELESDNANAAFFDHTYTHAMQVEAPPLDEAAVNKVYETSHDFQVSDIPIPNSTISFSLSPEHHSSLPNMGDVKTEYHPHSQIGTKMQSFEEYISSCPPPVEPDIEPWLPFKSRLDFEIAEVMLEAALNCSQKDRLIKLIHRAVENSPHDPFTLENGKGLDDMWDSASVLCTNFKKKPFTVPYKDEDWAFDLHMCDPQKKKKSHKCFVKVTEI
ncbi:hypothetical protein BDZ94DRAFT_1276449 [Collybia nuda]|uniref:Uncharacterized protein n=1 Tax=Collybia nuda TaxID=64659 RepID=A0A9P6CCL3_9AGAR|nr:hypothetical protein BDZ94DRAFT_1276449 [Collybia nuda]